MNQPVPKPSKFVAKIPTLPRHRLSSFQKDAGAALSAGRTPVYIDPAKVRFKKQIRSKENPGLSSESIEQLGEILARDGQDQPVIVVPDSEHGWYVMVAGERRCRAALLKSLQLLAVVREDLTEDQIRRIQRSENVDRENLTQLELAAQLREDKERLGTLEAVAEEWKRSIAWVSERLILLSATEQGGAVAEVMAAGASSDIATLTDLHRLQRADPVAAAVIAKQLQDDGTDQNARGLVRDALRAAKSKSKHDNGAAVKSRASKEPRQGDASTSAQEVQSQLTVWVAAKAAGTSFRVAKDLPDGRWSISVQGAKGDSFDGGFASLDRLVDELSQCDRPADVIIDMGTLVALARADVAADTGT